MAEIKNNENLKGKIASSILYFKGENGKSPYIGNNGNWFIYDDEKKEWVDTTINATVDLSEYYTKTETDDKIKEVSDWINEQINKFYTKEEIDKKFEDLDIGKEDKSNKVRQVEEKDLDTLTMEQYLSAAASAHLIRGLRNAIDEKSDLSKEDIEEMLSDTFENIEVEINKKANSADSLAGYGIKDAYTKDEINFKENALKVNIKSLEDEDVALAENIKKVEDKAGNLEKELITTNSSIVSLTNDLNKINSNVEDLSSELEKSNIAIKENKENIETALTIAKGRATGYIFDTVADLDIWLSKKENTDNLVAGDNFYIKAIDVPDYWWDGVSKQQLETQKVDLTEYYNKQEIDNQIEPLQSDVGILINFTEDLTKNISNIEKEFENYDTSIEVDNKISNLNNSVQDTFAAMQSKIIKKADKSKSLSGYGIEDAYTKEEIDSKIQVIEDAIEDKPDGDMKKNIYDKDSDGIVDKANSLTEEALSEINASVYDTIEGRVRPIETDIKKINSELDLLEEQSNNTYAIAAGANRAKTFGTYKEFINWVNSQEVEYIFQDPTFMDTYLPIGNNILIEEVEVPDLFIAQYSEKNGFEDYYDESSKDDELISKEIINLLSSQGFFNTKWLRVGQLETQKVDLTDYYNKTEVDRKVSDLNDSVQAMQSEIVKKADKSKSLSGYGIEDAYTKEEIDDLIPEQIEVVNNLTSTDTDKALSANQGKILNDKLTDLDEAAETALSIAKGRATSYVFDTVDDLDTWLSDETNTSDLVIGDNFYIKAIDVPDYWWDGTSKQQLETQKVDLTEYVKNTDYATSTTVGVVKGAGNYGTAVKPDGSLALQAASVGEIEAKKSYYKPITPYRTDKTVQQSTHQNLSDDYSVESLIVSAEFKEDKGTLPVSYNATKNYVDSAIEQINDEFDNYYIKNEVDARISVAKMDMEEAINKNFYTKEVIDQQSNQYAKVSDLEEDYYTKIEIDDLIDNIEINGGSTINVVDNLTSSDTDKALSANQGKILNEKTETLQENISDLQVNIIGKEEKSNRVSSGLDLFGNDYHEDVSDDKYPTTKLAHEWAMKGYSLGSVANQRLNIDYYTKENIDDIFTTKEESNTLFQELTSQGSMIDSVATKTNTLELKIGDIDSVLDSILALQSQY